MRKIFFFTAMIWVLLFINPNLSFAKGSKNEADKEIQKLKKEVQQDLNGLARMVLSLEESLRKELGSLKKKVQKELQKLKSDLVKSKKKHEEEVKRLQKRLGELEEEVKLLKKRLEVLEGYEKILKTSNQYPKALEILLKEKQKELDRWKKKNQRIKKYREKGFVYLRDQRFSCGGVSHNVEIYFHPKSGLEFVRIPEGKYYAAGKEVKVKSFLISRYEVSQQIWKRFMVSSPWEGKKYVRQGKDYPAVYVPWNLANEFCKRAGFRLPTQIEWEVACRGGTRTKYFWGDHLIPQYLWYKGNTEAFRKPFPQKVGTTWPNSFGLYDMAGNVWEWCSDIIKLPKVKEKLAVCRGGAWGSSAKECTSSAGKAIQPNLYISEIGFRPVFSLDND